MYHKKKCIIFHFGKNKETKCTSMQISKKIKSATASLSQMC